MGAAGTSEVQTRLLWLQVLYHQPQWVHVEMCVRLSRPREKAVRRRAQGLLAAANLFQ